MARPNLLLCFDAFGTLFKPKRLPGQQYAEVARQCGITGFSNDEVHASLKTAIKDEMKRNPNYGKSTGLGATKWWTNVIHKTFMPLLGSDQALPKELAPRLLHRFASKEGYNAQPNLVSTLRTLKQPKPRRSFDKVVIGVVTNSDDRVPSILSSFGLNISPLRYGTEMDPSAPREQHYDIDFHCMSYDVGVEKPDRLIFNAAELMLAQVIATRDGKSATGASSDTGKWWKVYVGDEYAKDVVGSRDAGWHPVLLDEAEQHAAIPRLEDCPDQTVDDLFKQHPAVRVQSLQNLVAWLTGER